MKADAAFKSLRLRLRQRSVRERKPTIPKTAAGTTTIPPPSICPSAEAWHSPTKASQSSRFSRLVVDGSFPAPIEPGSKNPATAGSELFPGPHVPPAAGLGNGPKIVVIAVLSRRSPIRSR